MALDSTAVRRLAHLARIAVDDDTVRSLGADLERILAMVDQLSGVDVSGITPMAHPLALTQRLREDVASEAPEPALYQRNASATAQGVYLVPKVIESA
ncbi:MAG: Asp-tRNA(Asn)/Glu-tRNA(Gln) amidotransferase subunit GatC [Gammaproteobacteria bacterium]